MNTVIGALPAGEIHIWRIEGVDGGRVRIVSCRAEGRTFRLVFRECLVFRWENTEPSLEGEQPARFHFYTPKDPRGVAVYGDHQAVLIMTPTCHIKIVFRDCALYND
jgi:hypothetical protein